MTLTLRPGDSSVVRHAIHRLDGAHGRIKADHPALQDASALVDVVWAATTSTWVDPDPDPVPGPVSYVVTSLDRSWNESVPQQAVLR